MNVKTRLLEPSRNWKLVLVINVFLGISLLFGMFTDFEFRTPIINSIFPFLVLGIGLITVTKLDIPKKELRNFLCLPSIVGGLPYAFLAVLVIINPFSWLLASQIIGAELVNFHISPNGVQVAEVHIIPGSDYEMESYYLKVKLRYVFLPFLVRDIYGNDGFLISRKNEVNNLEISWVDDNHLHVSFHNNVIDENKIIAINKIKFATPLPLEILKLIFHIR